MVQRKGLDIRSDNWLFHDNGLLVAETIPRERLNSTLLIPTSPEELGGIIDTNTAAIHDAMNEYREYHNIKVHPWIHTLKLAHYADTFTSGLTAESEALVAEVNANTNDNYPRAAIREVHHKYLDIFDELPFVWRVPGRMEGWNAAHDGLWLQIKHRDHYAADKW